ncbi:MAG: hypothetical protein PUE14_10135 [Clostridia bacterium]|nr:hypothetical protein [Clostridia bacterium]
MSFYSYKNGNPCACPGAISGNAMDGLQEKVCVQVKRVYDSCLQQEQLDNKEVIITSYAMVANNCNTGCGCGCNCGCGCSDTTETVAPTSAPVPPITFESCRSNTTEGTIRNLTVERLCDRPCFARVRCKIDVPIDILFVDSRCQEYIGKGVITVDKSTFTLWQRRCYFGRVLSPKMLMVTFSPSQMTESTTLRMRRRFSS